VQLTDPAFSCYIGSRFCEDDPVAAVPAAPIVLTEFSRRHDSISNPIQIVALTQPLTAYPAPGADPLLEPTRLSVVPVDHCRRDDAIRQRVSPFPRPRGPA
jgi:hypothetical protein